MRKPPAEFPAQKQWDFRKVAPSDLRDATIYEYARTSDKIRNPCTEWLQTKLKGKRIWAHIATAICAAQKRDHPETYRGPYPCDYPPGMDSVIRNGFWRLLGSRAIITPIIATIIMERKPDFPLPWLVGRLPVPKYARGRRVIYTPHLAGYQWVGSSTYPLDIEWQGATIDEIVDDFRDWVRVQAKHHPEMKGRGRAGQLQIAPLTWLAAYRIHKAGVTFEDAWFRLEAEPNHYGHLPIYSEKSGWSDAIKNATGLLSQIESGL